MRLMTLIVWLVCIVGCLFRLALCVSKPVFIRRWGEEILYLCATGTSYHNRNNVKKKGHISAWKQCNALMLTDWECFFAVL